MVFIQIGNKTFRSKQKCYLNLIQIHIIYPQTITSALLLSATTIALVYTIVVPVSLTIKPLRFPEAPKFPNFVHSSIKRFTKGHFSYDQFTSLFISY